MKQERSFPGGVPWLSDYQLFLSSNEARDCWCYRDELPPIRQLKLQDPLAEGE